MATVVVAIAVVLWAFFPQLWPWSDSGRAEDVRKPHHIVEDFENVPSTTWQHEGFPVDCVPDAVIVLSGDSLVRLDPSDGSTVWSVETPKVGGGVCLPTHNLIAVLGDSSGVPLTLYDLDSGDLVDEVPLGETIAHVGEGGDYIYWSTSNYRWALAKPGELDNPVWTHQSQTPGEPIVAGHWFMLRSLRTDGQVVDLETGQPVEWLTFPDDEPVHMISDGEILILNQRDDDGVLRIFARDADGEEVWRTDGFPLTVLDGGVWVTDPAEPGSAVIHDIRTGEILGERTVPEHQAPISLGEFGYVFHPRPYEAGVARFFCPDGEPRHRIELRSDNPMLLSSVLAYSDEAIYHGFEDRLVRFGPETFEEEWSWDLPEDSYIVLASNRLFLMDRVDGRPRISALEG